MAKQNLSIVSIPCRNELQRRLNRVLAECKRLRLLIRTARDLERLNNQSLEREGLADG